jgi:hypothetical protein
MLDHEKENHPNREQILSVKKLLALNLTELKSSNFNMIAVLDKTLLYKKNIILRESK